MLFIEPADDASRCTGRDTIGRSSAVSESDSACAWQRRTCTCTYRCTVELRHVLMYVHLAEKFSRAEIHPVPYWLPRGKDDRSGLVIVRMLPRNRDNMRSLRTVYPTSARNIFSRLRAMNEKFAELRLRELQCRDAIVTRGMSFENIYGCVSSAETARGDSGWKVVALCVPFCLVAKSFIYFRPRAAEPAVSSSRSVSCEPRDVSEEERHSRSNA